MDEGTKKFLIAHVEIIWLWLVSHGKRLTMLIIVSAFLVFCFWVVFLAMFFPDDLTGTVSRCVSGTYPVIVKKCTDSVVELFHAHPIGIYPEYFFNL